MNALLYMGATIRICDIWGQRLESTTWSQSSENMVYVANLRNYNIGAIFLWIIEWARLEVVVHGTHI